MIGADQVYRLRCALALPMFLRKGASGEIALPLVRMESSQKGAAAVDFVSHAEISVLGPLNRGCLIMKVCSDRNISERL
ncbi:hypothetical protein DPM13_16210 [Paracoccus mutanolyticus]|uniref:LysR substrate-binding domain-containing protein n=1 Tax=Paracoccus mutanolyticus TaxID=1499308 RepID=A0ABN5M8N7_9RHOB|nr:pyocin activator PrtN family protein [Paracoccus mutanolyticus]AWX93975.1 hypothetical protein DPM13_16210 [Paracoccus mutanolyticus]